jgi:hypothetical protein
MGSPQAPRKDPTKFEDKVFHPPMIFFFLSSKEI